LVALILLPSESCKQQGGVQSIQPMPAPEAVVRVGSWGGNHIGLVVTGNGVTVEFDCAHGSIDGSVPLDDQGRFAADGLYFQEQGGPIQDKGQPVPVKARYEGQVSGDQMTLSVVAVDTMEKIGTFNLSFGASARITRCL
jgi:hypothetical protein